MDLIAHMKRQRAFSKATFGPGEHTNALCKSIGKKLDEIESAQARTTRAEEFVDVVILALDGLWRTGLTPEEMVEAIEAKQMQNELRVWPDWRTAAQEKARQSTRERQKQERGCHTHSVGDLKRPGP
ncbi:MAG: dATP/dGTP pyrophosphohydrolase domain-containing protein [Pseudomonadota bacterium]